MERIQTLRVALQHLVESPRAPFLWAFMLCVFTVVFIAQVIGAFYVYTIVRVGMDGQKTQQEKKVDQEVQLIYDATEHASVRELIQIRVKNYDEALQKRAAEKEVQQVEGGVVDAKTTPQQKTPTPSVEQKKTIQ
jgi:hypothetical protein